jgi:flagellar protein FliS
MFGTTQYGASAYAKLGMETGVLAASPHKLIMMLFEGALAALAIAATNMQNGNIAEKGQAISKAIRIIENGLRESLDMKSGGSVAVNLDALYEYMSNRLLLANLNNDLERLEEVKRLLSELKDAWGAIESAPMTQAEPAAASL